jgi:hypothetical protein
MLESRFDDLLNKADKDEPADELKDELKAIKEQIRTNERKIAWNEENLPNPDYHFGEYDRKIA